MIGYYIHHHGSGHLSRATALARALGDDVTGLSSLPRPASWAGDWLQLPADTGPDTDPPVDPTANGALHWVPRRAGGVRARAAALSAWFERARPRVVVTDVSVEVALLARLHGIPVVVVAQPGRRDDEAHRLAYRIADRVVGFWPAGFDVLHTADPLDARFVAVGALSRFAVNAESAPVLAAPALDAPVTATAAPHPEAPEFLVFTGTGGGASPSALGEVVAAARAALPGARWTELVDAGPAEVENALHRASLVFSHCGQNAVAEIASARTPAVLVPEGRPFDEQHALAAVLADTELPVAVISADTEHPDWAALTDGLLARGGAAWSTWVDGGAIARAADVIRGVADDTHGAGMLALITIVRGRHDHLARQLAAIDAADSAPDLHVIVAMGDDTIRARYGDRERTLVLDLPSDPTHLPLAAARNAGAVAARGRGATLLVFLDVDCIPAPDLFSSYRAAARAHADDLLCGAVGYLPEGTDYDRAGAFGDIARFHGFRPRLASGITESGDHLAFWSLSFAVTPSTWERIGGFFGGYSGYGGEDTDFAMTARSAGVPLRWVGGAEAFHQYHPTSDPPVQHVNDILANGALFAERWGFWPMQGWIDRFVDLGLVEWNERERTYRALR